MYNNNSTFPKSHQLSLPPSPPLKLSPPPPMQPSATILTTSSVTAMKKRKFPPGYRFRPTDKELIVDYLAKKIKNLPLPCDFAINEIMLYDYSPDILAAEHEEIGVKEWYFFTQRDKKYKGGKRPNRVITGGDGYWKASGAGKPVIVEGVVVGFKRMLVYYNGKPRSKSRMKTNWLMNEFYMESSDIGKAGESSNMRLDWALCKIYNKDYKKGGNLFPAIICPRPLSSQNNSDLASTSMGSRQPCEPPLPPRLLDYGDEEEAIGTEEEIKRSDLMRAPDESVTLPTTTDSSLTENDNWWLDLEELDGINLDDISTGPRLS